MLHFRAIYLWDAQLAQSNKSPPPDPHPDPHPASPTPTLTEPSGTGGGGGEGVGRAGAKYNACSKHNEHNEPGSTDREAGIATDNAPGIATSRVAARAARQERKGSNSRGRDGSVGSNCRGRDARKQRRGNKESLESKERLERWCNASALGAAFGAGSMAVCPLMWQYAIQAEVFALNNFFVAVLLLLTVRYYRRARVRTAYFGSLAIGLGLTNQHTLLFYAAPLAACILHRGRKDLLFKPSRVAVLCAWGLLGLTPYIYLPLAGRRPPLGAWGEVDTAQGFSTHFLRKEYGTFRLYSGEDGSKESEVERVRRAMTLYLRHLAEDGTWVYGACPLVMLGGLLRSLCSSLSRSVFNSSASALLLAYLSYMIGFHLLANLPLDKALYYQVHVRFWMQAHVIAFAWLGLGVSGVLRAVETASWASPRSNGSSLSAPAATDACVRQGRLRIGAACCFLALLLQASLSSCARLRVFCVLRCLLHLRTHWHFNTQYTGLYDILYSRRKVCVSVASLFFFWKKNPKKVEMKISECPGGVQLAKLASAQEGLRLPFPLARHFVARYFIPQMHTIVSRAEILWQSPLLFPGVCARQGEGGRE